MNLRALQRVVGVRPDAERARRLHESALTKGNAGAANRLLHCQPNGAIAISAPAVR